MLTENQSRQRGIGIHCTALSHFLYISTFLIEGWEWGNKVECHKSAGSTKLSECLQKQNNFHNNVICLFHNVDICTDSKSSRGQSWCLTTYQGRDSKGY